MNLYFRGELVKVFVIKIGEKYAKYDNGWVKKVDTVEAATHFRTDKITLGAVEDLVKSNYQNVSYEEIK